MFGLVPMKKLEHDMMESPFSKMFDWTDDFMAPMWGSSNVFKVDVRDNGDSYELEADMPGLTKDNISMSYTDNYLTISAKKEDANDEKDDNGNYIRRERSTGSMSRSFYIDGIDDSKATADYKDGILSIHLPKTVQAEDAGHTISIEG